MTRKPYKRKNVKTQSNEIPVPSENEAKPAKDQQLKSELTVPNNVVKTKGKSCDQKGNNTGENLVESKKVLNPSQSRLSKKTKVKVELNETERKIPNSPIESTSSSKYNAKVVISTKKLEKDGNSRNGSQSSEASKLEVPESSPRALKGGGLHTVIDPSKFKSKYIDEPTMKQARTVLVDLFPRGLPMNEFQSIYCGIYGTTDAWDPQKYGLPNFEQLIREEADIFRVVEKRSKKYIVASSLLPKFNKQVTHKLPSSNGITWGSVAPDFKYAQDQYNLLADRVRHFKGKIYQVEKSTEFHIQIEEPAWSDHFKTMMDNLQFFYQSDYVKNLYSLQIPSLIEEVPLVIYCSEDKKFYRASFISLKDHTSCNVFLVDYGMKRIANFQDCYNLHQRFGTVPIQSKKVILQGIKILPRSQEDATQFVWSNIANIMVSGVIHRVRDNSLYVTIHFPSADGGETVNLNKLLVEKNYGKYIFDETTYDAELKKSMRYSALNTNTIPKKPPVEKSEVTVQSNPESTSKEVLSVPAVRLDARTSFLHDNTPEGNLLILQDRFYGCITVVLINDDVMVPFNDVISGALSRSKTVRENYLFNPDRRTMELSVQNFPALFHKLTKAHGIRTSCSGKESIRMLILTDYYKNTTCPILHRVATCFVQYGSTKS